MGPLTTRNIRFLGFCQGILICERIYCEKGLQRAASGLGGGMGSWRSSGKVSKSMDRARAKGPAGETVMSMCKGPHNAAYLEARKPFWMSQVSNFYP